MTDSLAKIEKHLAQEVVACKKELQTFANTIANTTDPACMYRVLGNLDTQAA